MLDTGGTNLASSQTSASQMGDRLAPVGGVLACQGIGRSLPHSLSTDSSAGASAAAEEGWTLVPNKQAGNPASKGESLPNPEKGKRVSLGAVPKTATLGSEKSRDVHKIQNKMSSRPSVSVRVKTWFDPDDRDLERGTRQERTAKVVLPPGTKNTSRSTFIDRVGGVVGLHALEACGPSAAPNIWLLTFATREAKASFVAAGNFLTQDGLQATVESGCRIASRFWIKLHWIPYQVTMVNALRQLEAIDGIKIIAANYDKVTGLEGLSHVRSLLRTVLIEAPDANKVPYSLRWSQDGATGVALVTVKGRPPLCLKCGQPGHVRKDCAADRCAVCGQWGHNEPLCQRKKGYASVAAGAPTVDEMADVIDEDMEPVVVGDQAVGPLTAAVESRPAVVEVVQGTPVAEVIIESAERQQDVDNSAGSARNTSPLPSSGVYMVQDALGTWSERLEAEEALSSSAQAPLSIMSESVGSSDGELSDSSVPYESPSAGSVSSSASNSKVRRRAKRDRDRLGSTQSDSPLAKK
jgi:Zinc knuckle